MVVPNNWCQRQRSAAARQIWWTAACGRTARTVWGRGPGSHGRFASLCARGPLPHPGVGFDPFARKGFFSGIQSSVCRPVSQWRPRKVLLRVRRGATSSRGSANSELQTSAQCRDAAALPFCQISQYSSTGSGHAEHRGRIGSLQSRSPGDPGLAPPVSAAAARTWGGGARSKRWRACRHSPAQVIATGSSRSPRSRPRAAHSAAPAPPSDVRSWLPSTAVRGTGTTWGSRPRGLRRSRTPGCRSPGSRSA